MYREVLEETGLNLQEWKRYEIMDFLQPYPCCRVFLIRLLSPQVPICFPPDEDGKPNHEIEVVEWVRMEDAFQKTVNSITREVLKNVRVTLSEMRGKLKKKKQIMKKGTNNKSTNAIWKKHPQLQNDFTTQYIPCQNTVRNSVALPME